jgi:hypothetical protein
MWYSTDKNRPEREGRHRGARQSDQGAGSWCSPILAAQSRACGPTVPRAWFLSKKARGLSVNVDFKGAFPTGPQIAVQLRRATLYPAELRVRGVHLADWRCVGKRPCRGWGGVTSEVKKATVTRSNRVGCAGKARARGAGAVAGSSCRRAFWVAEISSLISGN